MLPSSCLVGNQEKLESYQLSSGNEWSNRANSIVGSGFKMHSLANWFLPNRSSSVTGFRSKSSQFQFFVSTKNCFSFLYSNSSQLNVSFLRSTKESLYYICFWERKAVFFLWFGKIILIFTRGYFHHNVIVIIES